MLSLSLYGMLKLSKTISPQKLFVYDCITLYEGTERTLSMMSTKTTTRTQSRTVLEYTGTKADNY